jgi:hypothetical protein
MFLLEEREKGLFKERCMSLHPVVLSKRLAY